MSDLRAMVRDPRRAVWILPAVVVVLVVVLTALGISGTSTSNLTPARAGDASVRIGTPRAVRSDEWLVRTPMVLGQVARDFPRDAEVGVGTHDMSVLSELPTATWPEFFRPHQFGYFVLPVANGFAFEWWFPAAILILGVYALVLVVWRDIRWAAVAAVVLFASPVFHWWYQPILFDIVGWGAIAVAAFLASSSTERRGLRWSLLAVSTYATCSFALSLYPPAQIPLVYVFGAVVVGVAVPSIRERRWNWRRTVLHAAVVGGAAAMVVGAFVMSRHAALADIAGTVYPGARRETGGSGDLRMLFTGWFGLQYVTDDSGMRGALYVNESEASSFLAFGVLLLPAFGVLWSSMTEFGRRSRVLLVALGAVALLLVGHYWLGWPSLLLRLTLLDRVTVQRLIPALALVSVLLLVGFARAIDLPAAPLVRRIVAAVVTMTLLGFAVLRLGVDLESAGAPVRTGVTLLTAAVAIAIVAAWFWRPLVAGAVLAVVGLAMVLGVHPLVRGFGHVTDSEFATTVAQVASAEGGGVWLTDDWNASAVLTATGVDNLSGVNLYPNHDAWRVLDPDGDAQDIWNRFAHTRWTFDPNATAPSLRLIQDDVVGIVISPCDPALAELGVTHLVLDQRTPVGCMAQGASVKGPSGGSMTLWSR